MSTPYVGEIRMFGGNFAPVGWANCDGSQVAIDQNETLFQLIGTTYGGDGQTVFNLPDLQGRVPIHFGQGSGLQNYPLGQAGGVESVTLGTPQMPAHPHTMAASGASGQQPQPSNAYLAQTNPGFPYVASSQPYQPLNANSVQPAGGSQPHENMAPFLAITFIISLFGVFPSQQ